MSTPVDVSALRSLALQTKKRKVDEVEASSRPPVVSNTVANLTSGSSLTSSPEQGTTPAAKIEPVLRAGSKLSVSGQASSKVGDEGADREDGEISEDEEPLASPKPASPTLYTPNIRPPGILPPTIYPHNAPSLGSNNPLILPPLPPFPLPPPPTLALEPRFPPPSPALLEATNKPVGPKKKKTKTAKGSKVPIKIQPRMIEEPRKVDPVKAGADELQISEEEYAESRTLLIELLSWGVEPEYFVTQGFSRKALLVYCRDLKIRLPTNLPPAGILTAEKRKTNLNQEKLSQVNDTAEKTDSFKSRMDLFDRISMQDQTLDTVMTNAAPSTSVPISDEVSPVVAVENQIGLTKEAVVPVSEKSDVSLEKSSKKKKKRKTSDADAEGRTNSNAPISPPKFAVVSPTLALDAAHSLPPSAAGAALLPRTFDSSVIAKPLKTQDTPPPPPPISPPPPLPIKSPVSRNLTLIPKSSEPQLQLPSPNNHLQRPLDPNFAYSFPPSSNHHHTIRSPLEPYSDRLNPTLNAGTYGSYVDAGAVEGHPLYPQHQHQQQVVFPDLRSHHPLTHPAVYGVPSPGPLDEALEERTGGPHQFDLLSSTSNSSSTPIGVASPVGTPKQIPEMSLFSSDADLKKVSPEASVSDSDTAPTTSTTIATLTEVDLTAVEAHRKAVLQARKALLLEKKRMEEDKRTESTLSERLREKKEEVARREKELAERFRAIKAAKETAKAMVAGSEEKEKSERMVMSAMKKTAKTGKLLSEPSSKEIDVVVLSSDDEEEIEEGEVREDAVVTAEEAYASRSIPLSTPLAPPPTPVSTLASAPPLSSSAPSSPRLASTRSLLGPKQLVILPRRSASAHKRPSALDFDHKAPTTFGYSSNSNHTSVEGIPFSKSKPLVPEQAWRFVIDISDCEASDEEDGGTTPFVLPGARLTTSKKGSMTTTAAPSPPGLNGASTAEADMEAKSKLEAKESEIRRMVELIAVMEKKQKTKPAPSVSSSSLAKSSLEPEPAAPVPSIDSSIRSGSTETSEGTSSTRASPVPLPTVAIVDQAQEMLRSYQSSETAESNMAGEVDEIMTGAVGRLEEALEQRKDLLEKVKGGMDVDSDETTEQFGQEKDKDLVGPVNNDNNEKIRSTTSKHITEIPTSRVNPDYPSVTYTSPLAFFPLLMPTRSQPTQNQSESIVPALRTSCLSKRHLDPSRALCQWELQGGSCSDVTCQFTHWKDIEPTDDEIAAFLLDRFGPIVSAEKVRVVVRAARESSTRSLTFADVAQRASTLLLSLS
ncbi:Uncharacterized conserved protein [Phaffia rhodozyma]|uniref:Uncharacterized conserved protein n=1 Tax=Phaffia rhodozyma TaxID=264483 RepID=A0A0F7SRJ1_PHARH|nr:Uncharacterized conserved protein [Phaffia rhodozyma]